MKYVMVCLHVDISWITYLGYRYMSISDIMWYRTMTYSGSMSIYIYIHLETSTICFNYFCGTLPSAQSSWKYIVHAAYIYRTMKYDIIWGCLKMRDPNGLIWKYSPILGNSIVIHNFHDSKTMYKNYGSLSWDEPSHNMRYSGNI